MAQVWSLAVPPFELEPDETLEPHSDPGVERTVVADDEPDDERIVQALVQLHEGAIYTL